VEKRAQPSFWRMSTFVAMKKTRRVLELRPTQFAVGMMEVDEKIKIVRDFGKKKRRRFVDKTPVPVIRGHDGRLYIVDHHHFLCVCYHVGIKRVRVKIIEDLSKKTLSYLKFWAWMRRNRKSYPFCQFGEGPRKEFYLPKDIRGLADDPYRSLAWFVRKAGAFKNSEKTFAEFTWANFFRKKGLLDREGMEGIEKAIRVAVALAQSPEASKLPGYGKLNLARRSETDAKAIRVARKVKAKVERPRPPKAV
jgi:hypothetical protein